MQCHARREPRVGSNPGRSCRLIAPAPAAVHNPTSITPLLCQSKGLVMHVPLPPPLCRPLCRRCCRGHLVRCPAHPGCREPGRRQRIAFGGFPVGVQSYSLRNFNTEEAIRHLQGMGVHYVEFYGKHLDPKANDEQIAEVQDLLEGGRHQARRPRRPRLLEGPRGEQEAVRLRQEDRREGDHRQSRRRTVSTASTSSSPNTTSASPSTITARTIATTSSTA